MVLPEAAVRRRIPGSPSVAAAVGFYLSLELSRSLLQEEKTRARARIPPEKNRSDAVSSLLQQRTAEARSWLRHVSARFPSIPQTLERRLRPDRSLPAWAGPPGSARPPGGDARGRRRCDGWLPKRRRICSLSRPSGRAAADAGTHVSPRVKYAHILLLLVNNGAEY